MSPPRWTFALAALLTLTAAVFAGAEGASGAPAFDPLQTFAPLRLPDPVNADRSGDGAPGPAYWQNRADYRIDATLDAAARTLSGEEVITYTNNSPGALGALWLQLDQNLYRRDSRGGAMGGFPRTAFTDGYDIQDVEVEVGGKPVPAAHLIDDTRMRVDLPAPVKARGGKVKLHIRYRYAIPGVFGGRTAWQSSPDGDIFDIAQWYPRMAVYDDLRGWDTLPYLASEFYLEYGRFDYSVTVPADMIVAGSGELVNPKEVLTPLERDRLAEARASDRTVMIRTAAEVAATAPAAGAVRTWRFHMDEARDVAFAASRAFVWDAARVDLPGGRTSLAQSVYPAAARQAWRRSTEYLKDAIERYSRRWGLVYPYRAAINVGGPVGGMEYPGILFDPDQPKDSQLFYLTAHEIGHTWFPMVVGTNERRWTWMDEGLNTFIDVYQSQDFEGGDHGPKHDSEYAPGDGPPADQIAALIADPAAPPIMTRSDLIPRKYGHPVSYFKTAFGLVLLREDILGPDRFDPAFRGFIRDWAYKHPTPSDFFRAMDSAAGEDLSWFWRGWFFENWSFDIAVTGVRYVDGDPAKGAEVTLENRGRLVLPADLRVTYADGSRRDIRVPVETFMLGAIRTLTIPAGGPIADVVADPDHRLPDAARANNTAKPPPPTS